MKVNNGTFQIKSFITPTWKTIIGHFFYLTRSKLQKIFKKVWKLIRYDIKTKRHQNVIFSDEFREHGIQKVSSLGLHTSVKKTQEHYIRRIRVLNK